MGASANLRLAVDELFQPPSPQCQGQTPYAGEIGSPPVNELLRDLPKMLDALHEQIHEQTVRIRTLNIGE